MPKCDFNKVAHFGNLKSYFGIGVFLQICYIFSEHLFLRTPLGGCPCKILKANLNFNSYVISIIRKTFVLAKLPYYMSTKQRRIPLKTFKEYQLCYCPLVWMHCSRYT